MIQPIKKVVVKPSSKTGKEKGSSSTKKEKENA